MSMKMTFRWYGPGHDNIPLRHIRQIPGIHGVVATLMDIPAGDVWPEDEIQAMKKQVEDAGLTMEVIESVNVHEDIKLGNGRRDEYIENYITTIRRLGRAGVKVICYNFMPVFDWIRSDLAKPLADGSTVLAYDADRIETADPLRLVESFTKESGGFSLPGWEPERLKELTVLFDKYRHMDADKLFDNLGYFLRAIVPVCEEQGIRMAVHPDDPPWPIYGLPRIVTGEKNLERLLALVDSPANSLTLCTGSLGSNPENDIPAIVRKFSGRGRIAFTHIRNVRIERKGLFHESSHLSSDGSLDMFAIVKAFHDTGFDGYVRPDHGRMIWDENGRPGYGLYDRALGIAYLNGLQEAIEKTDRR